jgi:DNA-binding CsgD family transcriptional regulator
MRGQDVADQAGNRDGPAVQHGRADRRLLGGIRCRCADSKADSAFTAAGEVGRASVREGEWVDDPVVEPLSDRERDILHLLALGYTNQEIGKKLFISVRTVDMHRAHIMRKLQLETRAELVKFALANGVIGPNAD